MKFKLLNNKKKLSNSYFHSCFCKGLKLWENSFIASLSIPFYFRLEESLLKMEEDEDDIFWPEKIGWKIRAEKVKDLNQIYQGYILNTNELNNSNFTISLKQIVSLNSLYRNVHVAGQVCYYQYLFIMWQYC